MLGTREVSDKTAGTEVVCRNGLALLWWELGDFPTKQIARERFVGMSWRFCAGNSGSFRQNSWHGGGLSERAGGFVLGTLGFSDKTAGTEVVCRNGQAVLCWELWDFPTKQFARGCFVGMGWRFCGGNYGIFRQNSWHGGVLSEWAGAFVLGTRRFSDKTVCTGLFCRNGRSVFVLGTRRFSDKTAGTEAVCRNGRSLLC